MKARRLFALTLSLVVAITPLMVVAQDENPFAPTEIVEIIDLLTTEFEGKGNPADVQLAVVANIVAPFWTAAQIGSSRASSELGAPTIFQAPIRGGDIASQLSLLESLVVDQFKGIAFSAIDPIAAEDVVQMGLDEGINFITMDSDSPDSGRALYLGLNNYNAGFTAGSTMVELLGDNCGEIVGFVGFLTAQNAIDRIAGAEAAFEGTDCELVTVLTDDVNPGLALSNSEQALVSYPDVKGMIGFYSYNGPATAQALKAAGRDDVKLVAFDLEPETINLLREGVVSAAIGQRVYYYGYLSTYILYAMSVLGKDETMALLDPYLINRVLGDETSPKDILDTGADIVTPDTLDLYLEYLNSIGIASQ